MVYPWLSFWGGSGPCSAAHRLVSPQAELRALEEGDGSVSGSSPLSDGSQSASQDATRRLASKRGKWKLFVGAASPESTSRGSSKTGRESPEAGEAGNSKGSLRREARVFGKAAALSCRGLFPPKMRLARSPARRVAMPGGEVRARGRRAQLRGESPTGTGTTWCSAKSSPLLSS